MKTSDTISKLADALSKAQGEFSAVDRDRKNPFVGSMYATLAAVLDATRAPLAANGLSVVQTTEITETGGMRLLSRLMHVSGEWIESEYPLSAAAVADPQKMGSLTTYGRRYSYMALVGVSPEAEDDDGNQASGRASRGKSDRGQAGNEGQAGGQAGGTQGGTQGGQSRQAGVSYASQKQLNLLDMKGRAKYGDAWDAKQGELISRITSHREPKPEPAITDPAQLTSKEASELIDFVQGKPPTANGTGNGATPAPAATGSGAGR